MMCLPRELGCTQRQFVALGGKKILQALQTSAGITRIHLSKWLSRLLCISWFAYNYRMHHRLNDPPHPALVLPIVILPRGHLEAISLPMTSLRIM
ncbi:hypothetical protein JB92DRAFT_1564091 [Gautieria morchelliformis]|nr:hypothetical protein JB92DRAFT_1564091 [Gautieria morchelliformis]